MNDERVFQLLVEMNPVPTETKAKGDTMSTQTTHGTSTPTKRPAISGGAYRAIAAAVLVLVGIGLITLFRGDRLTGSAPTPTATYVGGACEYEGPTEIEIGSTVRFIGINASDQPEVGFSVWPLLDGVTADDVDTNGVFGAFDAVDPTWDAEPIGFVQAPTEFDTEYEMLVDLDQAGPHVVVCFDVLEGVDHALPFTVTGG